MRNLFLLLWKYQYFILFLTFESLCGYLIIRNNNFQNAGFINSANAVTANILEVVNSVTQYIGLKSSNQQLAEENAQLRALLPDAFYNDKAEITMIKDSLLTQQFSYIAAKVINNSTGRRNNFMTLNAGRLKGVRPEMSVICPGGIVGIVKDVSDNFSTVISVLNKDFKTSARLKKSKYFGNMEWLGGDAQKAILTDLPKHVVFQKGDTLVTTAFSSLFPEGILVGTVDEFEVKQGDNFYTITVNLSTDFHNLTYVYIVNDLLKGEQKILESTLKND